MTKTTTDEQMMRRCLQLARCGGTATRPNPMVGAVITDADGRIIGEGYHRRCGEAHAEVNAFNAVSDSDRHLLHDATIYVSLEPCSHYGKTPPCADRIISEGVRRVVVGCIDPFAKVQGRGISKLRNAGIDVTTGILEQECQWLNRRFFTFHSKQRPYIILKWAQSSNAYIDDHGTAAAFSTPLTQILVHQLRAEEDAIVVGHTTDSREHPLLTVRHWTGRNPRRFVLSHDNTIDDILSTCREQQLQSLIVEGGRQTLEAFIRAGLYDEVRRETATAVTISDGTPAPTLPDDLIAIGQETYGTNLIEHFKRK